jgi:hypothetical protein
MASEDSSLGSPGMLPCSQATPRSSRMTRWDLLQQNRMRNGNRVYQRQDFRASENRGLVLENGRQGSRGEDTQ